VAGKPFDGARTEQRVGVNRDQHVEFRVTNAVVQSRGLSAVRLHENRNLRVTREALAQHIECPILRTIVDNNDFHVAVTILENGVDGALDHFVFVISGNDD
jgi:hypothetical protein